MRHRHLDYGPDTSVEDLGLAALDDLLDRGDLDDWAPLVRVVRADPWGRLAGDVLHLVRAHRMYGTSELWEAMIASWRGCEESHAR